VLLLDIGKAKLLLGWRPRLALREAVDMTVEWYKACRDHGDMDAFCREQIRYYSGKMNAC